MTDLPATHEKPIRYWCPECPEPQFEGKALIAHLRRARKLEPGRNTPAKDLVARVFQNYHELMRREFQRHTSAHPPIPDKECYHGEPSERHAPVDPPA
ncbi:MAG: hypothetical protein WAL64_09370 [Candidatus Dormiibacterota bacterium]